MTDFVDLSGRVDFRSDAAKTRMAKRYRAEARFRSYGIIGLFIAAAFLVVLFGNILSQGLPAFWQHTLSLDLTLAPETIDPEGTRDTAKLATADYQSLLRDELRRRFPNVTSRADRKLLNGLLSSGAADELRREVVADPSLVGKSVHVRALLSDEADLYLKGNETAIASADAKGTATLAPGGEEGSYLVTSSEADFADVLGKVKAALVDRADALERESARLVDFLPAQQEKLAKATSGSADAKASGDQAAVAAADARLAEAQSNFDSLQAKAQEMKTEAARLRAAAAQSAATEQLDDSSPSVLVSTGGGLIKAVELSSTSVSGPALLPVAPSATGAPGRWQVVVYETPAADRKVTDREVAWLEKLKSDGLIRKGFNTLFFTAGDSREPELAGIRGALVGSLLTLFVTLVICLPIGVGAAIYLEEFAVKNRTTEFIEVNINNLAAVPSIVFGLLGLAMFLNAFAMPRSAALVGGLVLALLVLPTIIIASRAALKAVPPSIKEAALGVGASHQQAIFHHVLPLAMPGIMTGTIIGMAHALGETAPLLMIGMVAFIVDVPGSFTDAATVLPVQIFLWSDLPEVAFQAKTAAAIIVLLVFLFVMNGAAIVLRSRFQRRW